MKTRPPGVALAKLLLSVLHQVVAQPLMLGRVPGIGGGLAYPWLVAVATRVGDGDIKHHMWVPVFGKSLMMTSGMYLAFAVGGNPSVSILEYVLVRLVREVDKPASLASRTKNETISSYRCACMPSAEVLPSRRSADGQ